jgi:hypothetical protein
MRCCGTKMKSDLRREVPFHSAGREGWRIVRVICHPLSKACRCLALSRRVLARLKSAIPLRVLPSKSLPLLIPLIEGLEPILGPVKQDPQVFSVHPQLATNLVFVLVLQEQSGQYTAITFGEFAEHAVNPLPDLVREQ